MINNPPRKQKNAVADLVLGLPDRRGKMALRTYSTEAVSVITSRENRAPLFFLQMLFRYKTILTV